MSDQIKINTVGPADPNAGTRAKVYSALTLITPLLGFLATFGILSADQVNAVNGFIAAATSLLGVFGLFGFGVVTKNLNRQMKDGTFDPAPEPAPERNAFDALGQLQAQVDSAVGQAQARVAEGVAAIQGATALLPGGKAVIDGPLGDLLKAVAAVAGQDR